MEKGISSLLAVAKRRSLPALITFSAVLGGAIAYLAVAPRLYETSARLIYDDNKASVSEIGRDLTRESASVPTGVSPSSQPSRIGQIATGFGTSLKDFSLRSSRSDDHKQANNRGSQSRVESQNCPCYQYLGGELSEQRSTVSS